MEGVLNQIEFTPPRHDQWLMKAMGWKYPGAPHEGGIRDPRPIKLRKGSGLFRIGHSIDVKTGLPLPGSANLSNPWWLDEETFSDIAISADTIGTGRQTMARLKLSVAEQYGKFDLIFWVKLREPLGAFAGFGYPVYKEASMDYPDPPPAWAWPGRMVRQCYIPGLRDLNENPTGLWVKAFHRVTESPIPVHSWASIDSGVLRRST